MQRRPRPGKRPTSPFRWLWWLAGLVVISGIILSLLAPTLVTSYIRAYLHQDDFRQTAEARIAALSGGKAHLAPLVWNDDAVMLADLTLAQADGWSVDAGGLHAALDFGAIREGLWNIQNAGADDLTLRHSTSSRGSAAPASAMEPTDDVSDAIPAFLRRYIPTETKVSGFDVHRFFFEQSGWNLAETQLHLGAWRSGENSVPVKLTGGTLQTAINAPEQQTPLKLDLAQATLRLSSDQLQLSDATLRWKQRSEATLRGSIKFDSGTWQAFTHVKAVPLDEFLSSHWRQRLSGKIEGDLELSGSRATAPAWQADAVLKDGVLQGLPVLEQLATYTKAERFKRLVLDICQASFRPQGDTLRIEKIIVQSNGLLRLEGTLTLRGRALEGDFMLGVTPETLRWIPGADSRVFVENNPAGPPGMLWTRLRVAGTLDLPLEDLSARLLGAAGMSLLFDTPGKILQQDAAELLKPIVGEDSAKVPGKMIDGAGGLLENGVNTGAGLINQVLPVFPPK